MSSEEAERKRADALKVKLDDALDQLERTTDKLSTLQDGYQKLWNKLALVILSSPGAEIRDGQLYKSHVSIDDNLIRDFIAEDWRMVETRDEAVRAQRFEMVKARPKPFCKNGASYIIRVRKPTGYLDHAFTCIAHLSEVVQGAVEASSQGDVTVGYPPPPGDQPCEWGVE